MFDARGPVLVNIYVLVFKNCEFIEQLNNELITTEHVVWIWGASLEVDRVELRKHIEYF